MDAGLVCLETAPIVVWIENGTTEMTGQFNAAPTMELAHYMLGPCVHRHVKEVIVLTCHVDDIFCDFAGTRRWMSHLAEIRKHSEDQVRRVWSPDNNLFRQNSVQDEDLLRVWCKAKFWRGEVLRGYDRDRKMTKCVKHDNRTHVPRG